MKQLLLSRFGNDSPPRHAVFESLVYVISTRYHKKYVERKVKSPNLISSKGQESKRDHACYAQYSVEPGARSIVQTCMISPERAVGKNVFGAWCAHSGHSGKLPQWIWPYLRSCGLLEHMSAGAPPVHITLGGPGPAKKIAERPLNFRDSSEQ